MSRPLVYIAGPYSSDPGANTNRAIRFADTLLDSGRCVPIVPHLSHLWHTVCPRPWDDWIDYDLAILERCDGLIRLTGKSRGADIEVDRATELGLPVFGPVEPDSFWAPAVIDWLGTHWPREAQP